MSRNANSASGRGMGAEERTASLRVLLRWVRARRQGTRSPTQGGPDGDRVPVLLTPPFAGYAQVPITQLCHLLVGQLDHLPIDERAADALVRHFGLAGRPESTTEIAGTLRRRDGRVGLTVRRTQGLIRDAITTLAESLPHPPHAKQSGTRPARVHHPSPAWLQRSARNPAWRRCFQRAVLTGRSQARSVGHVGQRPRLSPRIALDQVEADALGRRGPTEHRGRPIEPWLRYRLRDLGWSMVVAADDSLGGDLHRPGGTGTPVHKLGEAGLVDAYEDRLLGPRRLATWGGPVAARFGEALTLSPRDLAASEQVLGLAEEAFRGGIPVAHELLGVARDGLVRVAGRADESLWSRALGLRTTLAALASDPVALQSAQLLERMRGPLDSLMLRVTIDLAATWSLHGHGAKAWNLLQARTHQLTGRPRGTDVDFYRAYLTVRRVGTVIENPTFGAPLLDELRREVEDVRASIELDDPAPELDLIRAGAELEAMCAMSGSMPPARRRDHLANARGLLRDGLKIAEPRRLLDRDETVGVYGHRPRLKWKLAELLVALASKDEDRVRTSQVRAVSAWRDDRQYPHLGYRLKRLMNFAASVVGTTPEPLAAPDPATGWAPDLRPPPSALPMRLTPLTVQGD